VFLRPIAGRCAAFLGKTCRAMCAKAEKMAIFRAILCDRDGLKHAILLDSARSASRESGQTRKRKTMATSKAAAKPAPTVTLKHLAAQIAEDHEIAKKQADAILGDLVGLVAKHLKKGDRIRIGGLGILQVRRRAARMGRNPATGEPIKIKASKKVAFRAAKELKESI
jgi:DNA-binding protein HU-beta